MSAKSVESKSLITHLPTAESISRKRTFTISQFRDDYRDAQTQFILLLTQLHTENFTGQVIFNLFEGEVKNVETVEKQKI